MRIISGKFKGKKINTPKKFKSRPTTDFAKEALFNIISGEFDFEKINVLDLFAGTGNISLEFLSRGCKKLTAIEKNKIYSRHIAGIFEKLFPENTENICADAYVFLKKTDLSRYDIIFADPPYDNENIDNLPDLVFEKQDLKENFLFILEHSGGKDFSNHKYFKEKRKYGSVNFSFFEKK